MRKPQQMLGYVPGLTAPNLQAPPIPSNSRLKREPDGPVSMKTDVNLDLHIPSPFRVGYVFYFYL